MPDIYVDGQLGTGDNNGTTWAHAYRGAVGLQAAFDARGAGDTLHLTRTFTLTAPIDLDQAVGSVPVWGYVLGYNYNGGSHVIDGTQSVLDGNDAATSCVKFLDIGQYVYFENIRSTSADGNGWEATANTATFIAAKRCRWDNNAGHGISGIDTDFNALSLTLCEFDHNDGSGVEASNALQMWACSAHDNGEYGVRGGSNSAVVDCVAYDNVDCNVYLAGSVIGNTINCRASGGNDGIYMSSFSLVACNRVTNAEAGDNCFELNRGGLLLYNYANTSGGTNIAAATDNVLFRNDAGVETNLTTGDQGYEDLATDKYNLRMGAAGFRRTVTLDDNNQMVRASGLTQSLMVWPGGN